MVYLRGGSCGHRTTQLRISTYCVQFEMELAQGRWRELNSSEQGMRVSGVPCVFGEVKSSRTLVWDDRDELPHFDV